MAGAGIASKAEAAAAIANIGRRGRMIYEFTTAKTLRTLASADEFALYQKWFTIVGIVVDTRLEDFDTHIGS